MVFFAPNVLAIVLDYLPPCVRAVAGQVSLYGLHICPLTYNDTHSSTQKPGQFGRKKMRKTLEQVRQWYTFFHFGGGLFIDKRVK